MTDRLLKLLMILFGASAALLSLYLMCGIVIILISYIWGIEPIHKLPLLFE